MSTAQRSLFPPLIEEKKPKRKRRRLPFIPRPSDVDALIAAAPNTRDRLIAQVLVMTGLRVAELCSLDILDIDLAGERLLVKQGKGSKDRVVPIPARLIPSLREWIGARIMGPLFPSPRGGKRLSTRAVQKLMKRLAAAAHLPEALAARRYTPHKLRHRYATNAWRKTKNIKIVQELLGHESISTTEIYTHCENEDLQEAVRDL